MQEVQPPSWQALSHGARPPQREPDVHDPGITRRGWQHEAASRVEQHHREVDILPRLTADEKAMLRSQSGLEAGVVLVAVPFCGVFRFAPHLFRVLLLRPLRLPLPPVSRTCRCIVQRAAELECWASEGSPSRVPEPGFAAKVALVSPPTCTCVIWTFLSQMYKTHDVWRSSPTVSRFSGEFHTSFRIRPSSNKAPREASEITV